LIFQITRKWCSTCNNNTEEVKRVIFLKRNGFTLIELLVVVAIIGIIAAVGVVAYNGYTLSAKINVVKANHATAVKYISNELMKCEIGQSEIFEGNLDCNDLTGDGYYDRNKIIDAAVLVMKKNFRNPFSPNRGNLSPEELLTFKSDHFTGISKNLSATSSSTGVISIFAPSYQYDRIRLDVCHPGIDPCYSGNQTTALSVEIIVDK